MKHIGRFLQRHAQECTGWIASLPPRRLSGRLQWKVWALVRDTGFLIEHGYWVATDLRGVI